MRLQPGSDVGIDREAVVGAGSLKLVNLRQNLKLLHGAERKRGSNWTKLDQVGKKKHHGKKMRHLQKPPQGGDTYSSALLKVDQASLQMRAGLKSEVASVETAAVTVLSAGVFTSTVSLSAVSSMVSTVRYVPR